MTDLVDRLRQMGNELSAAIRIDPAVAPLAAHDIRLVLEAADEIERLRDGIRMMRDDELLEIKRLRAALKIVATAELYDPATGIIDADVLEIAQQAARAALGEPKP